MPKGSGSIISSISSKTLAVSPANNDLVGLWPNLWCNNYKAIFFVDGNFFVLDISSISPKNECFLFALCGKVTTFFSLDPNYTVQNPFLCKQVCPEFINVIIENNLSRISGAKSTLCNVAIKVSLLLLHIFIRNCPFYFSMTWCSSATSIYLSVLYNEPEIKSETYGVIWHITPESKYNWSIANCHQNSY